MFVSPPCCQQCGRPFDFRVDDHALCGKCLLTPPHYDRVRSIFIYNDTSKKLILKLKHFDTTHLARYMAGYMDSTLKSFEADIISPIPLHWTRMLGRKFNQSALLMFHFSSAPPKLYDLLLRSKKTLFQAGLGEKERLKNVKSAFKVNPKYEKVIKGKNILLIDDVFTTGATVNECAKLLKRKGAKRVFCLTFARAKR